MPTSVCVGFVDRLAVDRFFLKSFGFPDQYYSTQLPYFYSSFNRGGDIGPLGDRSSAETCSQPVVAMVYRNADDNACMRVQIS